MKLVAKTDIGSQRSENQDSYRGGRRPDDAVWGAVCDGMGGARGGRLASTMAVDALQQAIEAGIDEAHTPQASAHQRAYNSGAHAAERRRAPRLFIDAAVGLLHGAFQQCASGLAQYVHVGDSRIYLFRNNKLLQLTKDHSMVQEMVEQGALTEEEAQNHPRKNLITRALGVGRDVEADFGEKEVSPRDILLLCSDGLSNCVSVPQIEETLARTPFYEAADALVQKALEGGGLDNITVLLMQVEAVEENNG